MRKLLTYLLLVCNLYAGIAYAWDTHAEASYGHDAVVSDVSHSLDSNSPSDADTHKSDHCCHGASHLIVLMEDFESFAPSVTNSMRLHSPIDFLAPHITSPLLRPPLV